MELVEAKKISKIEKTSVDEIFEVSDSIWLYQGAQDEPHALLASGNHSDGYINLNAVLQFPNLCGILAERLLEELQRQGINREEIDAVVSSSFAAITLGQEVARQLKAMFVFTEKEGDEQRWTGRFELPEGTKILQVEELITTLGTTRKVKQAVLTSNPKVKFIEIYDKTVVATIIHRPDQLSITYPDYRIIPVIEKEIHNWKPDECPLCKKGSLALKPKPNWQRFIEHR